MGARRELRQHVASPQSRWLCEDGGAHAALLVRIEAVYALGGAGAGEKILQGLGRLTRSTSQAAPGNLCEALGPLDAVIPGCYLCRVPRTQGRREATWHT